jgi:sporadic carbohydrate cluster 2OG-Fe(II) oxygenase
MGYVDGALRANHRKDTGAVMTISDEFLENGIVKILVEATLPLIRLGELVAPYEGVDKLMLNDIRLSAIKRVNANPCARKWYYSLAKTALNTIVGNELAMQRNINLSIQLPGDDSSLLPVHADSLQGDSPYEVVLWVPLVDCYGTKSMFFSKKQPDIAGKTLEQIYEECDPYFVDCKYGEALIFSQNWLHGNRVNETNETRWSLNCRFKSLFSPYADKKLGEFFEPIELRPATKMGLRYGS